MSFFALIDLLQHGPPPLAKPGILSPREFALAVAKIHTDYRALHGSYALRLSEDLMQTAQEWADTLASRQDLSHSNIRYRGTRVGENVAMKWMANKNTYAPQEICDQWYREMRDYEFGSEPMDLKAGHFTQMVWHETFEIGVGRSQARDGRSIVVVQYFPPGNVKGEFKTNVRPPLAGVQVQEVY